MTIDALAAAIGGEVVGDGGAPMRSCATLSCAGPDQVGFVSNPRYARQLETTRAGCVIVAANTDPESLRRPADKPLTLIRCSDPYFAFRQAVVALHGYRKHRAAGIDPRAQLAKSAHIGANVSIHANVVIGEDARIGDGCVLYPGVTIMDRARLGQNCVLYPNCTVYDACILGNNVILQAGAVIGSDGYGFATHDGVHHKIPQVGNVILEDDVEVGANSVIERAVLESTIVKRGTKLGNAVIIGHNCRIGEHNLLVSQVGIAGSTETGHHVVMAGQVGVAGHLRIGNLVTVAAKSGIIQDVPDKQTMAGSPAAEMRLARKMYFQFTQLPELARRVRALETRLGASQKPKADREADETPTA